MLQLFHIYLLLVDIPTNVLSYGQSEGIVINEFSPDLGENAFIELLTTEDQIGEDSPHFGIVIIESYRGNSKQGAKVVSIMDITDLISWPLVEGSYFLLGNPKDEWIVGRRPQGTSWPYSPSVNIRIYGMENTMLDVSDKKIKAVILTKSPRSIKEDWPNSDDSGDVIVLKEHDRLLRHIQEFQIDSVIVRHKKANTKSCGYIDKHIRYLDPKRMNPKYLNSPENLPEYATVTLGRCDPNVLPYYHWIFKGGSPTPFRNNDCRKMPFALDTLLQNCVLPIPESTSQNDPCDGDSEEDIEMEDISGEQLCDSQVDFLHEAASTDIDMKSCASKSHAVDTKQASNTLTLLAGDITTQKLLNESPIITEEQLAQRNHKKTEEYQGFKDFITEHQSHLFDINELDNFSEWFNLIRNLEEESESRYNCKVCIHHETYGIKTTNALSRKVGVLDRSASANMQRLRHHSELDSHQDALDFFRQDEEDKLDEHIGELNRNSEPKYLKVTCDNMRTAFIVGTGDLPLESYKLLHNLQRANGHFMGYHCSSRGTCTNMLNVMGDQDFDDMLISFKASQSPFGLICDGSR